MLRSSLISQAHSSTFISKEIDTWYSAPISQLKRGSQHKQNDGPGSLGN